MTATISHLYDDYAAASQAVSELERAGTPRALLFCHRRE